MSRLDFSRLTEVNSRVDEADTWRGQVARRLYEEQSTIEEAKHRIVQLSIEAIEAEREYQDAVEARVRYYAGD